MLTVLFFVSGNNGENHQVFVSVSPSSQGVKVEGPGPSYDNEGWYVGFTLKNAHYLAFNHLFTQISLE